MGSARFHTGDPDTSRDAAMHLEPGDVSELKRSILLMLRAEPRAAFQIASAYTAVAPILGWPKVDPYSIHRRMSELKKDELIYDTGERRMSPRGHRAAVLAVKPGVTIYPKEYR
jgi:hypothetical protein